MNKERREYLSDAELDALIRQVEEKEMLRAPVYMKDEILFRRDAGMRKIMPIAVPPLTRRQRKRELFFYSLKVGLAGAAAIAMVFLLPMAESGEGFPLAGRGWPDDTRRQNVVVERLSERTDTICDRLDEVSNWLISGGRK